MRINGSAPPPANPPNQATSSPIANSWRNGQVLQAIVIRSSSQQQGTLLQIGTQHIQVDTSAPLQKGQAINVEVIQTTPKPMLMLRTPVASNLTETVANSAIKQFLPNQSGLAPLLANLTSLTNTASTTTLFPPLMEAIKKVLDALPTRQQSSTAAELKEAFNNSGFFLENKIATGANPSAINNDLKANLLRLMSQLASAKQATRSPGQAAISAIPTPPLRPIQTTAQGRSVATTAAMSLLGQIANELSQQTEGALARLSLYQLSSLPQSEQEGPHWAFELPIRNQEQVDLFQLDIEEKTAEENKHKKDKYWRVMLAFSLENLGPMYVRLDYTNHKEDEKFAINLWAENDTTVKLINRNINTLNEQMKQAGLDSSTARCQCGTPPPTTKTNIQQTIVDIRV